MKLAIIGATGMVGQTVLKVLAEKNIKIDDLILTASERSVGKKIKFQNKEIKICNLDSAVAQKPEIVIFATGKEISLEWAPRFAENGSFVVDNSSAWRMHENIKLIVPEVNISNLTKEDKIISNPNCSTIQLVVILWQLHLIYELKRVVVSTYQSVSGSGFKGVNQLEKERKGIIPEIKAYPHQIDMNCIPHGGSFLENGYTDEEMKLTNESRKILGIPNLQLTSTVVRVPVLVGHSECVNIEFHKKPNIFKIIEILKQTKSVIVKDEPSKNKYPMAIDAYDKDEIFVGRIREDNSCENAINLWIVADNLRKGAATNAVQIAEYIQKKFL